MKKILLSTALSLALGTAAFAANVPEGTKLSDNQTYTYWMLDAIKTLDPQLATSVEDSDAIRSLIEGLYNEDADGNTVPGVALSHTLSDDKLTYTFTLRPDAKWSNGDPVTAQNFVDAWQRLADPATASEYAWYLELMHVENGAKIIAGEEKDLTKLGVTAPDATTLVVKLDTPLPYFPKMLGHTSTFPINKAVIDAKGADWTKPENFVGNGAYTLKEHVVGEKIVMAKSDTYWDAAHTVVTQVTGLTINDENAALTRWEAGELDRSSVPAGQYPALKEKFPEEATSTPYACTYIYNINLTEKGNPALQDVRVRKALSMAVDRDILINNILQAGQIPAYSWTPPAMNGFKAPVVAEAALTQADRDAMAVKLLEEAGFTKDNPLKVTLNYNTSEAHQKIAVAVQQMWKQKLGVEMTPQNFEWKVHTDKMHAQDFEMARYAWCGDYNEASTFLGLFTTTSGANDGKFSNADYDALIEGAPTAADPNENYAKAEQILVDNVPMVPLYHYTKVAMMKKDMKGYPMNNILGTWYAKDLYRVAE